ncbi:MAG: aminopeptidase [Chloroflexota bacterium]|nr:aminopeptidase [Chloroflexota bacterium]NOG65829.1 aminopeptidase [Chloroflexota bacterium]GIK66993.1 MAG: aminopeptidase [Chloroflexota bacterium]
MSSIPNFQEKLAKYADVIIRIGLNVQPGQRVLIGTPTISQVGAPIYQAPLVRECVRAAYQAGAVFVDVLWDDPEVRLARFKYAPRDSFDLHNDWLATALMEYANRADAILTISAVDPDMMKGHDPELISKVQKTALQTRRDYSDKVAKGDMNWCVVTAPVPGWSDKLFPDVEPGRREDAFWETLFALCRIDQPDPIAAWQAHVKNLLARAAYLNGKQYAALHYQAPGTDLRVGLPQGQVWQGAQMMARNGIRFTANIPTEEVFSMPHRDKIDGTVTATKPLNYGGALIENFSLHFENGRVVNSTAKTGNELLTGILNTDEGARSLGEVALVPHSSPISKTGRLFYSILIDENASNHLALGRAYRFSIEGGEDMSEEQFAAEGGNTSLIHIDFMIGSDKMDVDGITTDGRVEPVLRSGEWAFEV